MYWEDFGKTIIVWEHKHKYITTYISSNYSSRHTLYTKYSGKVRMATRGSLIGLRAFAPHDLYLASGSNHGPCRAWLGLGRVRVD